MGHKHSLIYTIIVKERCLVRIFLQSSRSLASDIPEWALHLKNDTSVLSSVVDSTFLSSQIFPSFRA